MTILKAIDVGTAPIPAAFLHIDTDAEAERLQIFERKTGVLLRHISVKENKIAKLIIPAHYAAEPSLMCVLLDDNEQFNAAIVDHVKPLAIDMRTFDPSVPISNEGG